MKLYRQSAFNKQGILVALVVSGLIISSSWGQYELSWYTIDGGGGRSSGGSYELIGTIGQPDAAWSSGGSYELLGGFWPGGPLCFVDFGHFARFADYWLVGDMTGDLDDSGEVDFGDVGWFSFFWLDYCPYGWQLK